MSYTDAEPPSSPNAPAPPSPESEPPHLQTPSGETTTPEYIAAKAKAQGAFKPVKMSGKNYYGRPYAQLGDGFDATREALAANNLTIGHSQRLEGNIWMCVCILRHPSGGFETNTWPIIEWPPPKNQPHTIASADTYARRYSMFNLLGIAGEPDDDAGLAHGLVAETASPIIDLDDAVFIDNLIRETKTDKDTFLEYVGAESVRAMTKAQYDKGLARIRARQAKQTERNKAKEKTDE